MKRLGLLKVSLLAMVWALSGNVVLANPITVDDAKQKAQEFFTSTKARRVKGKQPLSLAFTMKSPSTSVANGDEDAALYAFNIGEGNGFVIVSGDDVAVPILGYCDKGSFDAGNIPTNIKALLDGYAEQISWAKSNQAGTSGLRMAPKKSRTNIDYMLASTWNQNAPFNDQCIFNGTRCLTGCMATVLAQMTYFWATKGKDGKTFPCGSKALEAYTTEKNGYDVSALSSLNAFDWANMTDDAPTTTASKAAVSQLFRYCGQAIQADFDANGTSGSLGKCVHALKYNFGYNIGMSMVKEENYTASEWDDMVYEQLLDGKPVIISGSGNGSHAFICDGYDASNDTYHFNWGWGGFCDGWYAMTALNPSSYDYNQKKYAVINIEPFEESTYAVLSTDGKTLTFYHDTKKDTRDGTLYEMNEGNNYSSWYTMNTITDVVFDSSFAEARPQTTAYWFYNQANLKNVVGIENLNTSEVTSMYCMFYGCSALESLDVSHFNTSQVTTMRSMFSGCSGLTSLDVSHFNTTNVTEMNTMFYGCSGLTSLDLRSFDMSHVSSASNMLTSCASLKSLYIPLGIPDIGTYGCNGIGTSTSPCMVYAPEGYDFGVETSGLYFRWYYGYFYLVGTKTPYAILKDGTLSFYYDDQLWLHGTIPMTLNTTNSPAWYSSNTEVNTAEFAPSFAEVSPTSTYRWFYGMTNLTEIKGLEYLNTSNVTTMEAMFYNCSQLTSLDLDKFNTSNVTTMNNMFNGCSSLESLDVSKFNTSNVTTMNSMFSGCSGLAILDISSFDMSNVTSANYLLGNCNGLRDLYIPATMTGVYTSACNVVGTAASPCILHAPEGFDFGEVDTSALYFRWNSGYFFLNGTTLAYTTLVDGALTFYYDEKPWERPEMKYRINVSGSPSWYSVRESVTTVVFDESFAATSPVSTSQWFVGMVNLTNIEGMESLNTSATENMEKMFYGCTGLTSLDLSGFDMSSVTNAASMLYNCKGLKELHISGGMTGVAAYTSVCGGIGATTAPCLIYAPEGFDFGVDTSNLSFKWNSGTFYLPGTEVAYATLTDDKLTFYYDDQPWNRDVTPMAMNATSNPAWSASNASITEVAFDASFANARPTSTYRWFSGMANLTGINGLAYLNTTNVTNMTQMFYNCGALTSLDLSHLDMTNAASFSNVIYGCNALTQLYIHESMNVLPASACSGIGTAAAPCELFAPEGFDFGVDTSGDFFRWKQGYFRLGKVEVLLGDVNGDGLVNITDVVFLTNYVLEKNPAPFIYAAADVNGDGTINISDVVTLVEIVLNQD
ncbi:MAG: BspA family leucine-rich repeat surface protein [Prevotella sp.]|nr:BspA family leucine-rich repeat surface protein [Prevotella sp.]